jgi:hypothetical protein
MLLVTATTDCSLETEAAVNDVKITNEKECKSRALSTLHTYLLGRAGCFSHPERTSETVAE